MQNDDEEHETEVSPLMASMPAGELHEEPLKVSALPL
jgi:hypothetical protein